MKLSILIFYFLSLFSCQSEINNNETKNKDSKYSIESVEKAIAISTKIENNQEVTQNEWNSLFSTKGYENYFCAFGKENMIPKLKDAYQIVFDESRTKELDSILKAPVPMNASGQYNMIVSNLNQFKTNKDDIKNFMAKTDFEQIMIDAKKQTFEYLPQFAKDTTVETHAVNFVVMEPGAYVTDCGIVVDINHAFESGTQELQSLFAHEYHHDYRNAFLSIPSDGLMRQLTDLQAEGIADLVDKQQPPWKEMKGFPQRMVDEFNDKFSKTPEKLKELDLLTSNFVGGKISKADFDKSLYRFFWDGGHANGFYMSIKIVEAGLKQQMIETFNQPIQFIKLYNQAVNNLPNEYVLSDTFVDYITKLQTQHDNYISTISDETFEVTFKVSVPNGDDEVFIVGNHKALGDWKPDDIKMKVVSPLVREITLNISSPAEFKFTRGSWKKQAIFDGVDINSNLKLEFRKDTEVSYEITKWSDAKSNL